MAYISSISRLPILGDDFDLLFGGKNAGRILKLLVREIQLWVYPNVTTQVPRRRSTRPESPIEGI